MMTDEEKSYLKNLEELLSARTKQLREAVERSAELEKLLQDKDAAKQSD